ncbi:phage tail tip lysozyme [Lactococcus cremoris]|uniref:phage tail tip lysozyme n=1 Tax=Lactococcus lactis subsp. cremoris TaxID=1359 RepID=UPI00223AC7D2|nr:phage tail tip lysozyme [Lactococcus cremoris]
MKKWIALSLTGFIALGGLIGMFFLIFTMMLSSTSAEATSSDCSDLQNQNPSLPSSEATAAVEKAIFEHLTQTEGFSGAGGSGALAVAKRESGFDPKAVNTGGGVAGIFQWSGFLNAINGNRITSEGSIKAGDMSTLTLDNELKLLKYELNNGYKAAKMKVGTATDPQQAALDWSVTYEGVSLSDSQTNTTQIKADATAFYLKYKGEDIPSSITNSVEDGNQENIDNAESEANSGCEVGEGSGEQVKGTIKIGTLYNQLTPEQKKAVGKRPNFASYPDDPANAPYGHQCAWYVTFRAKEMGFPLSTIAQGNGVVWGQNDPNLTYQVGKPTPHAAVDFKQGQAGRGTVPEGHTAFVEYVNPDGSLIISECNVVAGQSGMDRSTAIQSEESYATISAEDAKTLTYVTPKGKA